MKSIITLAIAATLSSSAIAVDPFIHNQQDAYGMGTGMDQYGRQTVVEPKPNPPPMPPPITQTETEIQPMPQPPPPPPPDPLIRSQDNAYGLGVGMDQFGRPTETKTQW